jgi:hypothetical protein
MAIVNEHSMSFDALSAILTKYGDRVKYIKTENNTIALNQHFNGIPFVLENSDLEKETFDGYEFVKVKAWDSFNRKVYYSLIRMNDIRTIVVADKATDRIDPFRC